MSEDPKPAKPEKPAKGRTVKAKVPRRMPSDSAGAESSPAPEATAPPGPSLPSIPSTPATPATPAPDLNPKPVSKRSFMDQLWDDLLP
jgi:hypothetical protein